MIVLSNNETTVNGIYEKDVGVPASSLSLSLSQLKMLKPGLYDLFITKYYSSKH